MLVRPTFGCTEKGKSVKRLVLAATAAIFVFASLLPIHSPVRAQSDDDGDGATVGKCAVERWNIKTLVDPGAGEVNFTPKSATVTQLRAFNGGKSPFHSLSDARADDNVRLPEERQVYRVRAVLVGWKKEKDRDFHIVIADPNDSSATMIAEPPDSACSASAKAELFGKVRASFVKCFGNPTPRFQKFTEKMLVDLDGVFYYDPIHGQTGVSPNGGELHPLLRVKTVSGECPTGYSI